VARELRARVKAALDAAGVAPAGPDTIVITAPPGEGSAPSAPSAPSSAAGPASPLPAAVEAAPVEAAPVEPASSDDPGEPVS